MSAPQPDIVGLQVVYLGGINEDLDAALFELMGRDSNDSGCVLRTGHRDMFWRCSDWETAMELRLKLVDGILSHPDFRKACGARDLSFSVMTEDQHWEDKLNAIDEVANGAEGVKQK